MGRNPRSSKGCVKWDRWRDWTFGELLTAVHALHRENIKDPASWRDETVHELHHLLRKASQRLTLMWTSSKEEPFGLGTHSVEGTKPNGVSADAWGFMRSGV